MFFDSVRKSVEYRISAVSKCPAAGQGDYMPGSQKFSQNFHWKILLNFSMVFDVSLEMQSDSKNYVGV